MNEPFNNRRILDQELTKQEMIERLQQWIDQDTERLHELADKMSAKGVDLDDFLRYGTERSNLLNRVGDYKAMRTNLQCGRPLLGVSRALAEVSYTIPRR